MSGFKFTQAERNDIRQVFMRSGHLIRALDYVETIVEARLRDTAKSESTEGERDAQ